MAIKSLKSLFDQNKFIEYPTFYTYNESSRSPVVITVEHAGNQWPEAENISGMPENWQEQHYSYDRGAKEFALKLATHLNCPVVLGKYSRVLVDLNRIVGAEDIVKMANDGVDFAMNYKNEDGKKIISPDLADRRIEAYYIPYHQKVKELMQRGKSDRKHLCIHSYGEKRLSDDFISEWHLGIQYPRTSPMVSTALSFFGKLEGVCVGNNLPYNLRNGLPGAISLHAASFGIDTVELEFRDDQLTDFAKADFWLNATIQWAKIAGLGNQREPNKGSPSTLQSRAIK